MATYNRVSTTRSLGKKALQADVNKKKKELEEDSTRKWVQYLATLPTDQQNAARQELAQRMANPGNLRPATPSLRDMRYGVSSTQVVGNRELEAKNRAMGVYNTEAVAYNPDTAHLPSDSYMKQLQEALGVQLASSRVQDDFRRAQEERLSPWEDWYYNLAGEPDDYDLKAMDTLLTGKEYPSWYELTADERTKLMGDFTRMKAQVEGDLAQATPYQSQTPTLQARYDLLAKEQQRRSKGAAYQEMAAELQSSPTFEEDSKYTPATGTSYMEYMKSKGPWGQITSAFDKSDDAAVLYDYIMNPEYAAEYEAANNYQGHSGGTPYMRSGYGQLTQDEKNVLAAAWAQSPETFTETLSALEEDKRLRIAYLDTERALQENTALTPAGAVPSWMAARAANLANGLLYPVQMAASMLGYDDPYSDLYAGNRYVQNVSGVQSQAAGDLLPWKVPFTDQRVGELFYNGITSAVDMGAALGIGGLTKAPALATQLIMSSQAASNELHERLQDGMDSTEAVIRSLLVGGIEALTEKYSIDEFLADPKSVWAFITKNMFTEASEEGMSDLLNTAADGFISSLYGHDSDLVTEYNALVAQLGDEKVAFQTVLTNYLHKLGGNVILGGFTGGMMGGVSGAQTDASRKAAGKTIADAGNVPQLLDIAATMGGESGEMGRALKQTREQGGKISNRQVGRLYETMYKELDDQSRSIIGRTMQDAVAERLVELGDDEQLAREVAEAIMPVVRNEKPSLGQTRTMARSQNSTQVIKELMYADDTTSEGRVKHSAWARTAAEKATSASASSLRKMGELQATAVDQRMTDKAVKRSKVNAERLLGKKATDKKSLAAKVDGENVEILRVSQTVNGARLAVKAADGTTKEVDASNLELVSRPVAEIVAYVNDGPERMSQEQANLLLQTYTGGDAGLHITDFQKAYSAGYDGREVGEMHGMDASLAQKVAEQGQKDARAAEETRQKTIGAIYAGRRGAVTFSENAVDMGSEKALKAVSGRLSDTQKRSVSVLKKISHVTGVNFVLFESQADDTGRYTAENGHYDVQTGTIYLDLNSGKNSTTDLAEYAILRTAGHELTHFMEHSSKEGYAALRDFVTTELTRRGQDFDALVRQKIEKASTGGHPLTRAGAISEVVADASELMLRDTKAIERLVQKDQGLVGQIKGFLRNFVSKLRRAFDGVDAVHEEARVMMQELAEEFQQKWDFALEEAVEQASENAEAREFSDADTQYSIRNEPPPKKTGIAYKVFFEKNGKLYPPMVANPGGEDTPVGVWLNADVGVAAPPSKTGRLQVKAGGKGTQGGSGSLAFRPGWHLGDIPKATQFNRLNKATGVKELFPYNFVWAECEYAMDVDYQEEAMSYGYNANGKFQHSLAGLPRLPVDGYYHYRTNPDPNTVPWVITGAMKVTKILSRAEVDEILRQNGVEPTKWQGPDGEQMEADDEVKQYSLRDSSGNVITLSGEEVEQNKRYVANMDPIVALEGNPMASPPEGDFFTAGSAYFKSIGGKAENPVLGTVSLNEQGIRHLINRKLSWRKTALLRAVKPVIENGRLLHVENDHHNKDTAIIAATVELDEVQYYMGVVVSQNKELGNAYEVHDAVVVQKRKEGVTALTKTPSADGSQARRGDNAPSIAIILSQLADYNREFAETQESLRDMPADLTREYIANMTASDALNDVERDAIRIYSREVGYLRQAQANLEAQIAERDAVPVEKRDPYNKRVREARKIVSERYNKLEKLERTKSIQALVKRSREFVLEYVQGKTVEDMERLVADYEEQVSRLDNLIRSGEKDLVAERDKYQQRIRSLRSDAAKKILDEQERYRQMVAADLKIARQTREASRIQEKIATRVRKLDKLRRHETDYKNVPEAFKPAVDTLVSMFTDNFGTMVFDATRADKLAKVYRKLLTANGNDPLAQLREFYDPDVEEHLEALKEWAQRDAQLRTATGMTRMEKAALRLAINKGILEAVDHVTAIVTNAQDLFYAGKKAKFSAIGTQMGDELKARQDKKTLRGSAGQALTVLDNLLRTGNMTPVYFFERLGNNVLSTLWDDIRQGQNAYAFAMRDGRETIQGLQQRYHYWDWADSKRKDNVLEITTEKGRKLTFTREQALWVYATWKREQSNEIAATKHLTQGGIVYEGKAQEGGKIVTTVQATPAVLSEGDIASITGWLTDEQKAYADGMVKYLSEDMAELGNRASMEMFGIRKYTESYYFPYRVDGDQLYQSSASGRVDTTSDSRLKHTSFTHALTKGASAALVMGDFSTAVEDHITRMATYASFVLPIESMNRVLNYKVELDDGSLATVRSLIEQKYGASAKNYIATLLTDLNGGVRNDNRASGMNYFIRMYKKGAVAASLSVALQQPTSIFRAMAMISPKYIAASTFSKRDWEELTRYSGVAVVKDMGRFDTDVGRSNIDWLHQRDAGDFSFWLKAKQAVGGDGWKAFSERWDIISGFLPEKMDQITWAHLWNAVKKEQADLHPEMDKKSEAFLALCGERFNDIVDHTQVYDSILSRSQLMRGKDAMSKAVTSFKAEPTVTLNMLYNAAANINKPGGKAKLTRTIAAVMTSNIAAAAMAALVQAWNDDDDERTAATKYMDKFLDNAVDNNNLLTMMPVVSDVYSIIQGYEVERADMSLIGDVWNAFKQLDSESVTTWKKVENLGGSIAKFAGLSVGNYLRDLRRAKNLITSSFTAPSTYELSTALPWAEEKMELHYDALYSAMDSGDKSLETDIREYLETVKGKSDKDIKSGVKSALKDRVLDGSVGKDDAISWLIKNGLADTQKDAFGTVDEWLEKEAFEGDDEEFSYDRFSNVMDAVQSGNSKALDSAKTELKKYGYTDKAIYSAIRSGIGELFNEGKITESKAKTLLRTYGNVVDENGKIDENEIYWMLEEWKDRKAFSGEDADFSWSKYNDFYDAVSTGRGLKNAIQELINHGVEKDIISGCITNHFRKQLVDLVKTGKMTQAAALQAKILDAYVALGYDREKKLKDVKKWYEK